MQLNAIDTLTDTRTPFALVKLDESARIIRQCVNELPLLRKRLDRYKGSKQKSREIYTDLGQQHGRLTGALDASALALLEMEMPDMAGYSVKLGQSVSGFNLMTPDYTKLCAALNGYLAKLPIGDTPEAQTTSAHIIGRLMAHVKTGYYPTEPGHVKHIARGIGLSAVPGLSTA